jgi:hypothetical protein
LERFLRADPAVSGLTPYASTSISIGGSSVPLVGLGDGAVKPIIAGGAMPRAGEVALGRRELRSHGLDVGDLLPVGDGDALRIVGTALAPTVEPENPPGLGSGGIVSYDTVARLSPDLAHAGFLIDLEAEVAFEGFANRLTSTFPVPTDAVTVMRQVDPITVTDYRRVLRTPVVLAVVLAGLALVTLGLSLSSSLERRSGDFAVLRALGADRAQVAAAVGAQGALFTAAVMAVGLPLGLIAGRAAWTALEGRLGTAAGVSWPILPLLASSAVAAVALGLSMARPTIGLMRARIADTLAGE